MLIMGSTHKSRGNSLRKFDNIWRYYDYLQRVQSGYYKNSKTFQRVLMLVI